MPNETAAFSSPYRYIDISETATIPVDIENGALVPHPLLDATHTSYSSKTERTEAEGPYNGWIFPERIRPQQHGSGRERDLDLANKITFIAEPPAVRKRGCRQVLDFPQT